MEVLVKQIHNDRGTVCWESTLATELVAMQGPECFDCTWSSGLVFVLLVRAFGRYHSPVSFYIIFVTFLLSGCSCARSSASDSPSSPHAVQ